MGGKPFSLAPRRPGPPRRLVIEKEVAGSPLAAKAAKRLPVDVVHDRIGPADYPDFSSGQLVLAGHRGAFVKPCPGTRGYNCCGLQIIHFGLGCYLDCSYCILQGYLDTDALVLFANLDEGLARLRDALALGRPGPHRYCTGEFTDSLLLEDLTGLGARLTRMFSAFPQALLELKTKTDHVRSLLGLDHGGRTMVSFSVNAESISRSEEGRAAPLERRLAAARLLAEDGYRVGFHFDPLIRHPGWEDGYRRTVDRIFESVPAERIAWISLGAFRYLPRMKSLVLRRHPSSRIMDEEFILAPDGKMRYLRPARVEMYGRLLEAIRAAGPEVCVYMCMESPRVWREVFGFDPGPQGLVDMLDRAAR